jgi:hypothetical protein
MCGARLVSACTSGRRVCARVLVCVQPPLRFWLWSSRANQFPMACELGAGGGDAHGVARTGQERAASVPTPMRGRIAGARGPRGWLRVLGDTAGRHVRVDESTSWRSHLSTYSRGTTSLYSVLRASLSRVSMLASCKFVLSMAALVALSTGPTSLVVRALLSVVGGWLCT